MPCEPPVMMTTACPLSSATVSTLAVGRPNRARGAPWSARGGLQNRRTQPVTDLQGQLDVGPVRGRGPAQALLGLADPVLHRVLVQRQLLAGHLVTSAAAQEHQQGLPQPRVVLVVGGQAT